ncbi:MAG TPA: cytochrome c [Casimicrobiaceae bacterium]|nr:cytochrome c [Casimicrobiaceae bacterium]
MSGLRPGRLWMAAGLVCSLAGAAVAEPTLTVVAGGRTAIYTATGLLSLPGATSITVPADFAYKRSMTFRALPMSTLLSGAAQDDAIRVTAADGFRTTLPAAALLAGGPGGAYLAIEPADAPWPPLKSGEATTAGPFYLVWPRADRAAPAREQWPYQIVKMEAVAAPARRFPMTAPAASVPPNHPIRAGFAAFQKHCASCHTINGGGESTTGPDLNVPYNPTEYLRPEALRRVIRDPQALHRWPDGRMPAFDSKTLPDRELAELIAYLRHMADHKIAPPR